MFQQQQVLSCGLASCLIVPPEQSLRGSLPLNVSAATGSSCGLKQAAYQACPPTGSAASTTNTNPGHAPIAPEVLGLTHCCQLGLALPVLPLVPQLPLPKTSVAKAPDAGNIGQLCLWIVQLIRLAPLPHAIVTGKHRHQPSANANPT